MIKITASVQSLSQGKALLEAGVDTLYFGMEEFGLRLPHSFTLDEQKELIDLAHAYKKTATVAVNGIIHPEKMKKIPAYLQFLKEAGVDQITLGDPGIVYIMKTQDLYIPYLYDAETMVTSSRQINFWGKRGAIGAVVAREVPFEELKIMAENLDVFGEIQVFGPTCIHQSGRPLLQNYFNYSKVEDEKKGKEAELFISEPKKDETHYGIFEDSHGTHVFADNDLNLMPVLDDLMAHHFDHWKLDGLFSPEEAFVEIAKAFVAAKMAIEKGTFTAEEQEKLNQKVRQLYPEKRGLDLGFFDIDPESIH